MTSYIPGILLSDEPKELRRFLDDELARIRNSFDDALDINGRFIAFTELVFSDSPYTMLQKDIYIFCDTASGVMTVNLNAGRNGRYYSIKNYATSGTNAVIITPDGAELIEGAPSYSLSPPNEIHIVYSELRSGWFIAG